MFKVGDKVRYVDGINFNGMAIGSIQEISDIIIDISNSTLDMVKIKNIKGSHWASRFEPLETPKKYNDGKPRTDLISGEFILGLGKALQYGADKYNEDKADTPNYLKGDGFLYSDIIGALERHMAKFKSGENIDDESSLEHIIQVAVNAMFLYNYRISGKGVDNRVVLNEKK